MNKIIQWIIGAVAGIALILSLNGLVSNNQSVPTNLGGEGDTNLTNLVLSGTLSTTGTATIGSSGTAVAQLNYGSCQLQPDSATIAASTTARVTCHASNWSAGQAAFSALTGITSSSKIVASLSTTTAGSTFEGLVLTGVTASTTAGFIETRISNQTGTTYTWPVTGSASGTMQYIGIK